MHVVLDVIEPVTVTVTPEIFRGSNANRPPALQRLAPSLTYANVSLLSFCQSNVLSNSHRLERISFHLVATALTILDGPFWVYDLLHQRRQAPIQVGYLPLRFSPCIQY
jgi:hypothetical protein